MLRPGQRKDRQLTRVTPPGLPAGKTETKTASPCRESGMVTAELALSFPAVILIVAALGLTGAAGMGQVQANSASRVACRAVAAGQDLDAAVAAGQRLMGAAGTLTVSATQRDISCLARQPLPAFLSWLGIAVQSEAVIPREDAW